MLIISTFLLVALAGHSAGQLLFPANIEAQTPFAYSDGGLAPSGSSWKGKQAPRIAIIGGGAAGSSSAFFLSHFRDLPGLGLESEDTIFEAEHRIGGRAAVVRPWKEDPYAVPSPDELNREEADDAYSPVELGASIFVDANKNLVKAARVFNLSLKTHGGEDGGTGIWDGERFVYTESDGWGWGYWDIAKLLWRYGRAPLKARDLTKKAVSAFLSLYSPSHAQHGAFASLPRLAHVLNLSIPISHSALSYFASQGVGELFTTELIAAATQVNYGTPVSEIHGLGALVSLAATGAHAVRGGNKRIFDAFVGVSNAKLRLGKSGKVEKVVKLDAADGQRAEWVIHTADGGGGTFDIVVIATPFHHSDISLISTSAAERIPEQPYVPLHVSFIITNATRPSASFFRQQDSYKIPTAVFATRDTGVADDREPLFNSLNYLKPLPLDLTSHFGPSEYHIIKMFSAEPLSSALVDSVFGKGNVAKVWSRKWLAYPKLHPVEKGDLADVRLDEGLYYVNGFERLVSTMETETVAAFNVVNLLLGDLYGYQAPASWAEWPEND